MNPVDPTMPASRQSHPIQGLMETALNSIKGMIDVTTVVGEPVHTQDGSTIIPVSRVSLGFAAGGGEYAGGASGSNRPFGGGSGAGVSVSPIGFLVQRGEHVRVLSVDGGDFWDRLIDWAPDAVGAIEDILLGRRRETPAEPHPYGPGIDGP
jgi:sporulation protein YtfJ